MRLTQRFVTACLFCVALQLLSACAPAAVAPTVPPPTVAEPTVALTSAPSTSAPTDAPTIAPTTAPATAPTAAPTIAVTGEVSWMVLADPEQIQAFQSVATAFEAKYPGAKVNLASAADNEENYHAALSTSMAGGNPPDVVNLDYDATAQYAATGALQSIANDIAQSNVIHAADFYPQAWNGFQWQGQQICLPISISGLMVYYNKKLFDATRLAYPKAGWSWDEFLADAKALTKGTDQYGATIEVEFNTLLPFIWQNGGDLLTADGKQLALNTPADLAAARFLVDLQSKYHVAPGEVQAQSQEPPDRFISGALGMMVNSRAAVPTLRTITNFDWDVAPLPQQKQAANILKADGVCIPAKAKNPGLAWKLIEFAASPQGQQLMSASGRIVPPNIAVSKSPAFLDPSAKPANSQVWLDEIPNIRIVPALAHWPDIEEIGNTELKNAYYGHATADQAVQEIINKTQRFLLP